ncbi:MAG: thiamine-phosphate kinase [Clostridia bacterium]
MANDEFSYIRQWTGRSAGQTGDGLVVGIGDYAAVFAVSSDRETVACCDAMIETVHFLRETMHPADIGYKSFASNISDIAAMGGIPRYALVTIGLSPAWTADECDLVYEGMYEACSEYGVRIIGGDTVSTPDALHLSVTLIGEVERGKALLRSTAKPGDAVFVTGALGASAAGLHLLQAAKERGTPLVIETPWKELASAHQRPKAQVQAGRLLHRVSGRGALNDVSDGLASELWEIAEASSVAIRVDEQRIPVCPTACTYGRTVGKDALDWALYGGEDYQLVGTVARAEEDQLVQLFNEQGLPLSIIGEVAAGEPQVSIRSADGMVPLSKGGYNHFST